MIEAFSEEVLEQALKKVSMKRDPSEKNFKGHLICLSTWWHSLPCIEFILLESMEIPNVVQTRNFRPTWVAFQHSGSETQHRYYQLFTRILRVCSLSFRINTAGSWMWERYFFQYDAQKEIDTITYKYDDLKRISGVLWEQTLTYAPDNKDIGIQLSIGFPFQVFGERDLGEPFVDSFKAGSFLNFKSLHLGYTYTQYSEQFIHMTELGFGYLF